MIPFHLIQYSACNNSPIHQTEYTLSLGINYYQTLNTCTHNHYGNTSVCKTDFVQIFVKFDYWYKIVLKLSNNLQ